MSGNRSKVVRALDEAVQNNRRFLFVPLAVPSGIAPVGTYSMRSQ